MKTLRSIGREYIARIAQTAETSIAAVIEEERGAGPVEPHGVGRCGLRRSFRNRLDRWTRGRILPLRSGTSQTLRSPDGGHGHHVRTGGIRAVAMGRVTLTCQPFHHTMTSEDTPLPYRGRGPACEGVAASGTPGAAGVGSGHDAHTNQRHFTTACGAGAGSVRED